MASAFCLLLSAFCLPPSAYSQTPKPYAAINRDAVTYNGPGRDGGHDLPGTQIRIGLLVPLTGPRQAEGQASRRAGEMAIEEVNATPLPGGRCLALVTADESGPWGQASTRIARLIFDDEAVALITSTDGRAAHLAEQVATKIGVPVMTLSTDNTLTEINLPWIFRLGPSDAMQAQAFAHDIYETRKLQRVLLLNQDDHDGTLGAEEFIKAARAMNAPDPARVVIGSATPPKDLGNAIAAAEAIVIWTDAPTAKLLAARVREEQSAVQMYLCRKAAAEDRGAASGPGGTLETHLDQWVAAPAESQTAWADFSRRYRLRFGAEPGISAAETFDAVRVTAASLREAGPNRARLRDRLAATSAFAGVTGTISFDHAGNDTSQVTLLKLK